LKNILDNLKFDFFSESKDTSSLLDDTWRMEDIQAVSTRTEQNGRPKQTKH